jgi:1,4-alpha-glucan branching enzyme
VRPRPHSPGVGDRVDIYRSLGAHPVVVDEVEGVRFAVWAPGARQVSAVGTFNDWDSRRDPMQRQGGGVWEKFIPGVERGALYKFAITGSGDNKPFLKADPFAFRSERSPGTASVVEGLRNARLEPACGDLSVARDYRAMPISIYEVHLASWKRRVETVGHSLTYDELADELIPYAGEMGFTHLELLPIMEHPFDGSWGYLPTGLFAPTARHGPPSAFRRFVDRCHEAKLGVILDWVPGHFPDDPHGLARFDGGHLYEYADPRLSRHKEWNSLVYNFGRGEISNFLIASAVYWLDQFGVDGLRVDAVTAMLYRDFGRNDGEWTPNELGGRENFDAVEFLRRLNDVVRSRFPDALMIAEEASAWPRVTGPRRQGGLGFTFKWNMGWANDTLRFLSSAPHCRSEHRGDLTFGLERAFDEAFILPLSHDEVVREKTQLLHKISGDEPQRFATLRAYLAFMFAHPGKKLLFMGTEFAQTAAWDHDSALDWQLLRLPQHKGVQRLVTDLNHIYRESPALYELDCAMSDTGWINAGGEDAGVISFNRRARNGACVVAISNFTNTAHDDYVVGVPTSGVYREILNTDSTFYGGANLGNFGTAQTKPEPARGVALRLTLPPLSTLWLSSQAAPTRAARAQNWTKGQ